MMEWILFILGFVGGYIMIRRLIKIESHQIRILGNNADIMKMLADLIQHLQKPKEEPTSEEPKSKKVIRRIKKSKAYMRTPEFKKKMSDLTKARWAKKKGHITPMAPITQETGDV